MLKKTGIVRPIDNLGRLVVPRELRKLMDIEDGNDCVEFFVNDDEGLVIKKYQPACIFCNSMDFLVELDSKLICKDCVEKLNILKENLPDTNILESIG